MVLPASNAPPLQKRKWLHPAEPIHHIVLYHHNAVDQHIVKARGELLVPHSGAVFTRSRSKITMSASIPSRIRPLCSRRYTSAGCRGHFVNRLFQSQRMPLSYKCSQNSGEGCIHTGMRQTAFCVQGVRNDAAIVLLDDSLIVRLIGNEVDSYRHCSAPRSAGHKQRHRDPCPSFRRSGSPSGPTYCLFSGRLTPVTMVFSQPTL